MNKKIANGKRERNDVFLILHAVFLRTFIDQDEAVRVTIFKHTTDNMAPKRAWHDSTRLTHKIYQREN